LAIVHASVAAVAFTRSQFTAPCILSSSPLVHASPLAQLAQR
jgi:hypothetical protein